MKHLDVIIRDGQIAMQVPVDVVTVLEDVREQARLFFAHRPSDRVPSRLDVDPSGCDVEIERIVCGILLGALTRGAIVEALDAVFTFGVQAPPLSSPDNVPNYGTAFVDRYDTSDGEHQFMEVLVATLEAGLAEYRKNPGSQNFESALDDAVRRLAIAERCVTPEQAWTTPDGNDPKDRVLRTLSHNAETAMMFVRIFPVCVLSGYERVGIAAPAFDVARLQGLFVEAIPTFALAARVHLTSPAPRSASTRHVAPISPESFLIDVSDGGDIRGFAWRHAAWEKSHRGGRCPAGSPLISPSPAEMRVRSVLGIDPKQPWSTAETLLQLAGAVAPELWRHQYEANLLCIDLGHADIARTVAMEAQPPAAT